MRKSILVLFALFVCMVQAKAQFGTERETASIPVISFPKYVVPIEQRTYYVEVTAVKNVAEKCDLDEVADRVAIWGWSRVANPDDAFLKVYLDFKALIIENSGAERYMARDGKEFFKGCLDYTLPAEVKVVSRLRQDEGGNVDWFGRPEMQHYKTAKDYPSPEKAKSFIKDNMSLILDEVVAGEITRALKTVNSSAEKYYGYSKGTIRTEFWHLDSKKSQYFAQQESDYKDVLSFYKLADAEHSVSPGPIKEIIGRYKNIISQLGDTERKEKNAKVDLMKSVAEMLYVIEEYDEAEKWARDVMAYDKGDGEDIIKKVRKMRNELDRFGVKSCHFVVEAPEVAYNLDPRGQQFADRVVERVVEKEKVVAVSPNVIEVRIGGTTEAFNDIDQACSYIESSGGTVNVKLLSDVIWPFRRMLSIRRGDVTFDCANWRIYGPASNPFLVLGGKFTLKGSGVCIAGPQIINVSGGEVVIDGGIYDCSQVPVVAEESAVVKIKDATLHGYVNCLKLSGNAKVILYNTYLESSCQGSAVKLNEQSTIEAAEGQKIVRYDPISGKWNEIYRIEKEEKSDIRVLKK